MKKTALRYGLLSGLTILVLFLATFLIFGKDQNYGVSEIVGYSIIVLSMLFVFFGIKHYRDHENNGAISFGTGLKLGVLIVLIPAIVFGLYNVLYVAVIDPEFTEKYYSAEIERLRSTLPPADFEKQKANMESQKQMFSNPMFNFLLMFLTVFVIGVIVSVISSLVLRREGTVQVSRQ